MNTKTRLIILFLLLTSAVYAKSDETTIKKVLANYQQVATRNKGIKAIRYIDQKSLNYYTDLLDMALYTDSNSIKNLSAVDRIMIGMIRDLNSDAVLSDLNGSMLYTQMVDNRSIGPESLKNFQIISIDIQDGMASAKVRVGQKESKLPLEFYFEEEQWKINLPSAFSILNELYSNNEAAYDRDVARFIREYID